RGSKHSRPWMRSGAATPCRWTTPDTCCANAPSSGRGLPSRSASWMAASPAAWTAPSTALTPVEMTDMDAQPAPDLEAMLQRLDAIVSGLERGDLELEA